MTGYIESNYFLQLINLIFKRPNMKLHKKMLEASLALFCTEINMFSGALSVVFGQLVT